jgi:hypothetical protein
MEHPPARALAVVPIARCPPDQTAFNNRWENSLIVLGIILLVIGVILVVVGAIFALLGFAGREIGGRKHWY